MTSTYFITGIGTEVGKTVIAAIVTEALQANYWKPVQAGYVNGTDSKWIKKKFINKISIIYPESYELKLAASPHIGAGQEGIKISFDKIIDEKPVIGYRHTIEGAEINKAVIHAHSVKMKERLNLFL